MATTTTFSRIAAVTGGNKGVGLGIVRQLALQYPKSPFNNGPFLIYLTARDENKGTDAVASFSKDPLLVKAKALVENGGLTTIKFKKLDINDSSSIKDFGSAIKADHPDGIDVLINNAGIAMHGFDLNVVETTLKTNYYGTVEATQTLLPQIKKDGRIVNVASMAGHLTSKYSDEIIKSFLSASEGSVSDCDALMEQFTSAVKDGQEREKGWPQQAYSVSKAGLIAATKVIAKEAKSKGNDVLINACCPGWVKTDMTKGQGHKTEDEGALTPVQLAILDIQGKTGTFWQNEKEIEWQTENPTI